MQHEYLPIRSITNLQTPVLQVCLMWQADCMQLAERDAVCKVLFVFYWRLAAVTYMLDKMCRAAARQYLGERGVEL